MKTVGFIALLIISGCGNDDDKYLQPQPIQDSGHPAITSYDGSLTVSLLDKENIPLSDIRVKVHLEFSQEISTPTTNYYTVFGNGTYTAGSTVYGQVKITEGMFSVKKNDPARFIAVNFTGGKLSGQNIRLNLSEIEGNEISGAWVNQIQAEAGILIGNTDCQKGLLPLPQ